MIKAKIQLFDDSTGKNIGDPKIVFPEAFNYICLPESGGTIGLEFDFEIVNPANMFEGFSFEEMKGSIIKEY